MIPACTAHWQWKCTSCTQVSPPVSHALWTLLMYCKSEAFSNAYCVYSKPGIFLQEIPMHEQHSFRFPAQKSSCSRQCSCNIWDGLGCAGSFFAVDKDCMCLSINMHIIILIKSAHWADFQMSFLKHIVLMDWGCMNWELFGLKYT